MALVDELRAVTAKVVSSDVYPRQGMTFPRPVDFTKMQDPPDDLRLRPRVIITNPPFSLATAFMRVGLKWVGGVPGAMLALFLPIGALGGQARAKDIYADAPPTQILVFSERIDIFPDGYVPEPGEYRGGVIEYAWFIWLTDVTSGALLTQADSAAYGVPPLAWVPPGLVAELDPEAAEVKRERRTKNKRAAAQAVSRRRRGCAIIPSQDNADGA